MAEAAVEAFADDYAPAVEADVDPWNGRKTRFTLAYPLIRDFGVVAEGEQIVLRCSRDASGVWHGPDADHLRTLIGLGHIQGTPEADQRRQETGAVAAQRGVGDVLIDPATNQPARDPQGRARRKFEELKPLTGAQMRQSRVLRDGMFGDQKRMQASERVERNDAVRELTEQIVRLASGGQAYAGAQGPASAQAPDGTRIVKEKS